MTRRSLSLALDTFMLVVFVSLMSWRFTGVPIHEWPTAGAREVAQSFDALLERLMRSGRQKVRR